MSAGLTIRPATIAEYQTAVDWAAEGWNPGLDDLAAFYNSDPEGFLMGWRDGASGRPDSWVGWRAGPTGELPEVRLRAGG